MTAIERAIAEVENFAITNAKRNIDRWQDLGYSVKTPLRRQALICRDIRAATQLINTLENKA